MLSEIPSKALRNLFGSNISVTQVLQAIASGMADCGVDVVIDPRIKVPCADPKLKKIWLPASVRSERALLVVSWFLDHEASHIIYTPDLRPVIDRWQKEGKIYDVCINDGFKSVPDSLIGAAKGLLNMVEDSRIEHLMSKRLPGTKKHFLKGPTAAGVDTLIEEVYEEAKKLQQKQGKPLTPLNPFWVGQMHAYCLLDGWHGQKEKDYCRRILPAHVHWVMDIIDDEFGDIRDVTQMSWDDVVSRTETAMAKIIEKVLENSEEQEGDGDGEGQEGGSADNPYQDEFTKNKTPEKGDGSGDGEESGDQGTPMEDSKDGSGKAQKKPKGAQSEEESGEEDSESAGSPDGEGDSEDDSDGAGQSDSSDGDGDSEDSGSGSSGGSSCSEDDDGESDDGGSGGSDGSDDSEESEESSDGDEGEEGSDVERGDDGDGEPVEEDESCLDESPVQPKALPKQVEEWAEDAQADMADLIRAAGEAEAQSGGDVGSMNGERPAGGASPNVPHETSTDGMPEKYYDNLAPGLRSIVIEGVDLKSIISQQDEVFQIYDDFVRTLMPPNLGPAARKLVGKFKSAPGEAWTGNRVNPRMLQPIVSGKADGRPLFMRRNQTTYSKRGVAVMMMLDCSGSMCDSMGGLDLPTPPGGSSHGYYGRDFASKFVISHAAIRSLARVLQASGISFAVGGFTGTDAKHVSGWSRHARTYDLVNFMFKDFHEPWTSSEQKMIAMNPFTSVDYKGDRICSHTNCDGESLLWAATRLLARDEDIKVLIVASDGLPAGGDGAMQTAFLKYVVKRLELANIYVGALGIGNQGVKHYYRIHELIDYFPDGHGGPDTAPLYVQEKVIKLIDHLMVEGGNPNE